MKTSEFKKRVKELRYEVVEIEDVIKVRTYFGKDCARLCTVNKLFMLNTENSELAKLVIEYAETPIHEREEEKKYIVILPDPRNDGEYRYALCKRHDGIGIGHVHRSGYSKLTEAEIKRNHEYLWQFAKEVEE